VKRRLPMALAIGIGVLVLLDRFISNSYLDALGFYFLDITIILAAFALLLGFFNVLAVHVQKVRTQQSGWPYSIILILFALFVLIIGLAGPSTPLLRGVFNAVLYPIQATIASLLIFFVASAAFRALKVRNGEAIVLVGISLIVLLGQVPLAHSLTAMKDWILAVPGLAGVRGLILGVALGTVVTGVRVLMGLDRPYSK
jgi:hypothetical protein